MKEDKIYPSMVIRSQAEAIELLEKENEQLKIQISAREEVCNKYEKALFEIRDKLYCWGEVLDANFQQDLLEIVNKELGSGKNE